MDVIKAGRFDVPILYLDNHILAVEKPPNMPVQQDASGDLDLLSACKHYIAETFNKPGAAYLGLVHRLDRPVGGVMVLARTSKAAERLSKQFAERTLDKTYLCVLRGELLDTLELTDDLLKDERTGSSSVVPQGTPGAKLARLESRPLVTKHGLTLAEVKLFTGRSHQIRVQHAHAGYPLWGDARYGNGQPGEQIALWANVLTIEHPTLKHAISFTSQPPNTGAWRAFSEVWNR